MPSVLYVGSGLATRPSGFGREQCVQSFTYLAESPEQAEWLAAYPEPAHV